MNLKRLRPPVYDPKGNSRTRNVPTVHFEEADPPADLSGIVHRVLHLRTARPLADDYRFHALPDACTYLIFDQSNPQITGHTRLRASSEELSLGHAFHFVNVRLLPGVWQGDRADISYGPIDAPYAGDLPLIETNDALIGKSFDTQQAILWELIAQLRDQGLLAPNPVTAKIFAQIDDIHSVADMALAAELSARQLQRLLKQTTGFAPHDFLKIIRLQQSLGGEPSLSYADQSHFIHSFRKATGYTPGAFARKFDV